MDEQHRKLIELINMMYHVMRKEEGPEKIDTVLDEMSVYASSHLREEEALLQANGYPPNLRTILPSTKNICKR